MEAVGEVWGVFSSSPCELVNSESWNRFPIFGRFRWLLRVRVETGVLSWPEKKTAKLQLIHDVFKGLPVTLHRNSRTMLAYIYSPPLHISFSHLYQAKKQWQYLFLNYEITLHYSCLTFPYCSELYNVFCIFMYILSQ